MTKNNTRIVVCKKVGIRTRHEWQQWERRFLVASTQVMVAGAVAYPRATPEPTSVNPTIRDRKGACGNVGYGCAGRGNWRGGRR